MVNSNLKLSICQQWLLVTFVCSFSSSQDLTVWIYYPFLGWISSLWTGFQNERLHLLFISHRDAYEKTDISFTCNRALACTSNFRCSKMQAYMIAHSTLYTLYSLCTMFSYTQHQNAFVSPPIKTLQFDRMRVTTLTFDKKKVINSGDFPSFYNITKEIWRGWKKLFSYR